MNPITALALSLVLLQLAAPRMDAQAIDTARLRELRQKAQGSTMTPQERAELEAAMKARAAGRTPADGATPAPRPAAPGAAEARRAEYAERQEFSLQRMREMGKTALEAAAARKAGGGPKREFFVNNEIGDDQSNGLSAERAVRSLQKGISLLKPGDVLHLAITSQPYRETLKLGDDFGGVAGKPITIEGHGATIDGCDPLRLDGWTDAGTPGLYKSAKFMSELEEFTDEAKLMRVFFMFDGVVQHMGRSSKGAKPRFKSPSEIKDGEWTYAAAEKVFYLKVTGPLAGAKVSAPYRRNGVSIRAPQTALTHVIIKDLIVSHALNDGFNLHGATKDLLLQNIAAFECGDDGISPHETCEVTIDGYWGVGNSTGMGNGFLSVTKASNIRLEGNLGHQFMSAHEPNTILRNAIITAPAGTYPINITNSQNSLLTMDNVLISAAPGQKILNVVNSRIEASRITVLVPEWENAGAIHVTTSVIGGTKVTNLAGGTWIGERNVQAIAFGPEATNTGCVEKPFGQEVLKTPGQPFPGAGAMPAEFKIPPRPVPHPAAGKFSALAP